MRARRRLWNWIAGGVLVLLAAALAGLVIWRHQMDARLLITDPADIARRPDLVRYAVSVAKPAYASHCASCHGDGMQGEHAKGAPSLKDRIWLYEDGSVGSVERTLLYGIRSGNGKARNITDMPPLGRNMQLSSAEVTDVATYVRSMSGEPGDPAAVQRGSNIFQTKGVCYDCHSGDASGNPDYGAPALNDREWLYGGDFSTVYNSIYSGRHGICPAWIGKLKPAVIRALAVYLNQVSHGTVPAPAEKGKTVHG
jgi:cytochrome c oxidase cbb3-type subunit III